MRAFSPFAATAKIQPLDESFDSKGRIADVRCGLDRGPLCGQSDRLQNFFESPLFESQFSGNRNAGGNRTFAASAKPCDEIWIADLGVSGLSLRFCELKSDKTAYGMCFPDRILYKKLHSY